MSALVVIPADELRAMLQTAVREGVRAALAEARTTGAEDEEGYLAIQRAAEFADVHPDTIRVWIKAGRLRGYRAGRELRVLRSELRRFLERGDVVERRPTPDEEAASIFARRRSG